MPPIQLVVFDMAGTTVTDQHEVERCFTEAAAQTSLPVSPERILAVQGMGKRQVFQMLWAEQLGEQHPELERHVNTSYAAFRHILETHYQTQGASPTEGCLDTFAYLHKRGIAIALTTGFYRAVTDIILEKLGWLDGLNEQHVGTSDSLIQASVASDEVAEGRPAPLLIERAMHLLGVTDPKAVVNVGDTPSDLLSGQAAGVRLNLGVVNGTHSLDQLQPHPHDQLLASLAELPAVLEAL
ncbi:Haloacid dehalogenase domain protein hydrolase [Fibrella aestuarina BUZ 2]|uniref:Haloacid dehalogenase domain protein hydrolase n=1 Tax=Fibrella aestuarina BUZ 2 TaxID=1166018 RepID=I0KH23_9BACT|nr:HAD family hydrolase [Fibrella aestuarina]CCH03426.1 Haloacid dehalogenase domain protein hydrolase [Fibrella aestuarina BUZ 2]